MRQLAPLCLPLALTACAMPTVASGDGSSVVVGEAPGPEVAQDVLPVVWAATDVFERAAIPVAYADEIEGEVRSGAFRVRRVWGGEDITARVRCPTGFRLDPRELYDRPFDVSVVARAQDRGAGRTRVIVSGRATTAAEGAPNQRVTCSLREEFRTWLADEIRRRAMNQPRRPRGAVRPTRP